MAAQLARAVREKTCLKGNAASLSKQVMKYSKTCDDIALFDWETMIIFDFSETVEDARSPIPTKAAHLVEKKSEGPTFRLLLLGFLLRAVQRHIALSDRGADPREHRPTNYEAKFVLSKGTITSRKDVQQTPNPLYQRLELQSALTRSSTSHTRLRFLLHQ